MDQIINYFNPEPEKTITQKCTEYISSHPEIIYKGVPLLVVGWYAFPVIMVGVQLAPWLYIGYNVQKNTILAKKAFDFYNYTKSLL
jgi:hypothetical protein